MLTKVIIGALAVLLILVAVACAGPTPAPVTATPAPKSPATQTPTSPPAPALAAKPSGPIKATWIEPQVSADTISIPQSEIEKNWNVHFKTTIQGSTQNFIAYLLDGKIQVRASVCPPCGGKSYTLDKDILVCDMCGTTFKATTGDGIKGAPTCVTYHKASVSYQTTGGNLVMKTSDLFTAYQNTMKAGWP